MQGCKASVPAEVLEVLRKAHGTAVGRRGCNLLGHELEPRLHLRAGEDSAVAAAALNYGELLPGGAAKAFLALGLAKCDRKDDSQGDGCLLELGMGTGMVVLQAFVQCHNLQRVIGVELSASRFEAARSALQRLAAASPEEFQIIGGEDPLHPLRIAIATRSAEEGQRLLELRCGDFLSEETLTNEELQKATAVMLQVVIPDQAQLVLQKRLGLLPDSCRLFSLCDFRQKWVSKEDSCLRYDSRPLASSGTAEDECEHYACSWEPDDGVAFHVYVVEKSCPTSITAASAVAIRRRVFVAPSWGGGR